MGVMGSRARPPAHKQRCGAGMGEGLTCHHAARSGADISVLGGLFGGCEQLVVSMPGGAEWGGARAWVGGAKPGGRGIPPGWEGLGLNPIPTPMGGLALAWRVGLKHSPVILLQ